jgi:hypothetical protein
MLLAALLWMPTTYMAYWQHMKVASPANARTENSQGDPKGQEAQRAGREPSPPARK